MTEELFEANKKNFLSAIVGYKVCNPELINSLAELGLFEAPASGMLSMHNAFTGGLIDHLLKVASYSVKLNDMLPEKLKQTKESLIRVSLLHSIGKVGLYIPNKSDWHVKNLGQIYEFNNEITSMTVGERSVYYLMLYNNCEPLTDFELQAILNHEKTSNNKSSEWFTEPLGEILRIAIKLAILDEKR